ncbi:MAG: hypothetical protein QM680_08710 [Luteolibacter sp.]
MKLPSRAFWRRALLVVQLLLLIPIGWFVCHVFLPRGFSSKTAEKLPLSLSSGAFSVMYYPAEAPKGIVIVATGDGGWSDQWEEPTALHLAEAGYAVGGWDCRDFADTRKFDKARLTEAFNAAVAAVRAKAKLPEDTPVWFTGWSTGAEWSLCAASGPDREKHLVGVLPAAPGAHSRFGISESDLLGVEPSGPGTYALADLADGLEGLPIVQFAGEDDPLDDVDWAKSLKPETPYKLITIPGAPHDMDGAGPRFLAEFDEALQWTRERKK